MKTGHKFTGNIIEKWYFHACVGRKKKLREWKYVAGMKTKDGLHLSDDW